MKHNSLFNSLILITSFALSAGDGTLDPSFGTGGVSLITLPVGLNLGDTVSKIFIDAAGQIYYTGGNFLARFTPAGELDTSFNSSGSNPGYVALPATVFNVYYVLVQPDNKILVCGWDGIGIPFITRINPDGSFDQTFNNGQIVLTPIGSIPFAFARALALQPDGKILASVETESAHDIIIIRYNTDGSLDSTFGTNGIVQTPVIEGTVPFSTTSLAVTSDNTIIVGGFITNTPIFTIFCARYTSAGTLDTTFAITSVQPGIFFSDPVYGVTPVVYGVPSVVIQPDGKIVISASIGINITASTQLIRLTPQGVPDTGFNGTGFSQILAIPSMPTQLTLQSDGKLVVTGFGPGAVGRFTTDGLIDTTFNSPNGYVINSDITAITGAAIQSNGYIVVGGVVSPTQFELARYIVNNTPLVKTSISTITSNLEAGSAQSNSIVTLYVDGQQVCVTESINNTWSCSATITPGTHTLEAVAHYPAGNINLAKSCLLTFPISALSAAVISKYCAC